MSEQNLWEEDWDDDDGQDEVSNKLREELKKQSNQSNSLDAFLVDYLTGKGFYIIIDFIKYTTT